jgi:PAS domain S-box-containing protein
MAGALDSRYFPLILDVLDQGVFTVDEKTRITSFNRAAEIISGHSSVEVLGQRCAEVFKTDLCASVCPLRHSIQCRSAVRDRQVYMQTRDGRRVPILVSTAPLVTPSGSLLGGVEVFRNMSHIVDLERRLGESFHLADIVGKSRAMQHVFDLLPLLAESDATVLITGASGTGKELVARALHALSPRKSGPFVAVNCAAIPDALIESELFGHRKGAFTDAKRDRPGRIAAAAGGTLLLDEIAEITPPMQVKILRFVQDREYTPVGANGSVRADVRIVAATNRDLPGLIGEGRFREDLYYRLNVVQIELPALRHRPEDIPLLVNHFVNLFRESTHKPVVGLTDEAIAHLMAYPFPGNVRELENTIERGFVLCQGDRIGLEHLPSAILGGPSWTGAAASTTLAADRDAGALRRALDRNRGNRTHAAAELGIHRTTLLRRLKRAGLG